MTENQNEMVEKFIEFQKANHLKNQKKIKVGLKVNILLPLVFLIICFLSKGSKLVFLILWIVSLFGISFYLIYTEYTDHLLVEKLREFGVLDEDEEKAALIGETAVEVEAIVSQKMDQVDDFIDTNKKRLESEIEDEKKKIADKVKNIKKTKGGEEDEKHSEN